MPVSGLRLFADENIEASIVEILRALGHDLLWLVTDQPGLLDDHIPALMAKEDRVLLTYDVDFVSALRLSGRLHNGAILVRAMHATDAWIAASLDKTLRNRKIWLGCIAVIKPNGVRYSPPE
jgi:predicted nuclease of predicted toxin-antitoxin system